MLLALTAFIYPNLASNSQLCKTIHPPQAKDDGTEGGLNFSFNNTTVHLHLFFENLRDHLHWKSSVYVFTKRPLYINLNYISSRVSLDLNSCNKKAMHIVSFSWKPIFVFVWIWSLWLCKIVFEKKKIMDLERKVISDWFFCSGESFATYNYSDDTKLKKSSQLHHFCSVRRKRLRILEFIHNLLTNTHVRIT